MKTGINMLLWTTLVAEEHFPLFTELKKTGFDGAEIPIFEGSVEHYTRIGRELVDRGLECTASTALDEQSNPVGPDKAMRYAAAQRMRWTIERAAALGSKVLCGPFHSAYATFTGVGPTEEEREWCAEVMRESAEVAEQAGITLACEFLNRFECYMLTTAAQALDLVRRVDHPSFTILYDTHHAHIEEKSASAAIASCAGAVGHVHVSENDRGTPGTGQVDWSSTFRSLKSIGYDGWLVIEAFSRIMPEFASAIRIWRDLFPSPEEVYREGHRFMRESWGA